VLRTWGTGLVQRQSFCGNGGPVRTIDHQNQTVLDTWNKLDDSDHLLEAA